MASEEAWKELCRRNPEPFIDNEEKYEPYGKIIEYNNRQLAEELIPLYKKMLEIFSKNYYLAEPKTSEYYGTLCEFIEIWDRSLSKAIPNEVAQKLDHREEKLYPFYDELENRIQELRSKIIKK